MASIWCAAVISVVVVNLVALIWMVAIPLKTERLQQVIFILVSLAVGAMFGDAFIHLLPDAFEQSSNTLTVSGSVLFGLLTFFLLEKFLLWRHEHIPHYGDCIHPVGYVNFVAEGLHHFIDGLLIGASYMAHFSIGLGTSIAVLLHEIPQEIGNFGVLIHAGFNRTKAIGLNFLSASFAIIGVVVALLASAKLKGLPVFLIPFTAGGFIYIAGSDLVPELHKEREPGRSLIQLVAIIIGVGVMLLLALVK